MLWKLPENQNWENNMETKGSTHTCPNNSYALWSPVLLMQSRGGTLKTHVPCKVFRFLDDLRRSRECLGRCRGRVPVLWDLIGPLWLQGYSNYQQATCVWRSCMSSQAVGDFLGCSLPGTQNKGKILALIFVLIPNMASSVEMYSVLFRLPSGQQTSLET